MAKKPKPRTCVSLEREVATHLNANPVVADFSGWVNQKYREEFMREDVLRARLQLIEHEAKAIKETIQGLRAERKKVSVLLPGQKKWIKEIVPAALKKGATRVGLHRRFVAKFDREDIGRRQFWKLYDLIRGGTL